MSPIAGFAPIVLLDASNNQITAIPDLRLPQLTNLNLSDNPLSNLANQHLSNQLKILKIDNSELTDLTGVGQLPTNHLSLLRLNNNGITDISPLEPLLLRNALSPNRFCTKSLDIYLDDNLIEHLDVFTENNDSYIFFRLWSNKINGSAVDMVNRFKNASFSFNGNDTMPIAESLYVEVELRKRAERTEACREQFSMI